MDNWEKLFDEINVWADQTFGKHDGGTSKALHLREEAEELLTVLTFKPENWKEDTADELADIILIAMHCYHCNDIDALKAVRKKFEIVKTREWHPPDHNGVIRHVK